MGRLKLILLSGLFLLSLLAVQAGTYTLNNGQTVSGDPISYDQNGVIIGSAVSARISWTKFSQESLKQLVAEARRPEDAEFIKPHLEETRQEQKAQKEIVVKQPERVELPKGRKGLFAALGTPLGFTIFLILYAANLYAAYEIAIYRKLPLAIPCGVSAGVPLIGPIIFLAIPPRLLGMVPEEAAVVEMESAVPAEAPAQSQTADAPPASAPATAPAAGTAAPVQRTPAPSPHAPKTFKLRTQHLVAAAPPSAGGPVSPPVPQIPAIEPIVAPAAPVNLPPVAAFKRGEFTFNRRFFETKAPGFFRVVPSEADKDLVLYIKAARGEFVGKRISKISQTELHLLTFKEEVTAEEMIPFTEIYEVEIRHKDMV
jgi:hypothetical protein